MILEEIFNPSHVSLPLLLHLIFVSGEPLHEYDVFFMAFELLYHMQELRDYGDCLLDIFLYEIGHLTYEVTLDDIQVAHR